MAALGKLGDGVHQLLDLLTVRRMPENGQAEGRLGDEDVAGDGIETRARGIAAALVVAGDDHGEALPPHHRLGGTQNVARRRQGNFHGVSRHGLAISQGAGLSGEIITVSDGHDRQGFGGRHDQAVAGARMIRVAVGDDRAIHRPDRVDVEVARRTVEAGGPGTQERLGPDHPDDIGAEAFVPITGR